MPDQVIAGRYRLLSRLGSGGMGLVFLAEQVGVGNRVAIKFLDPEPNADESRIARFLREAKVALEVKHPGAAQLLDLGRDEAMRLYLVFEYVEGRDLRELLREESRLRYDEAKEITLKIAETLSFAHVRHIVHRDIKPENIRIRRDLAGVHVKVLDFGIARLMKDGGVRLTAEGSLAGTPRYMAPEQIRDTVIDGRTDLYALGLVFFEMLAGSPAFTGKNISQILLKQVQEPLPMLRTFSSDLNFPEVDDVLSKACAKDQDERYPTMADFVAAVRQLPLSLSGRWPTPKVSQVAEGAKTRDGRAGLSDTLIRAVQTDLEIPKPVLPPSSAKVTRVSPALVEDEAMRPHPEAPTEPERGGVTRRQSSEPVATSAPELPVAAPRSSAPVRKEILMGPRDSVAPTLLGESLPQLPVVKRSRAPVAVAMVVLLLASGAAIAWWMGLLLKP